MLENKNMPEFGVLSGFKIAYAGGFTAGPFAPSLLADYGADVIWLESAAGPDGTRFAEVYSFEQDRRNQRNMAINIPSPEGKEIFKKVIANVDAFLESSKGGTFDKWGLTDKELWKVNPKLVIVHVSGFGQSGLPEYVSRAAYDSIAQAFTGYTWANMNPVSDPYAVGPYVSDFITALFAALGLVSALHKVQKTGKGESIDVAQIDCMLRVDYYLSDWLTQHKVKFISGNPSPFAGCGPYKAKDGKYIQMYFMGAGVMKKVIPKFGLEYGSEDYPEGVTMLFKDQPSGKRFDEAMLAFLGARTAKEAEAELLALNLPVAVINDFSDVEVDPHVAARGLIAEYKNIKGTDIKCASVVPQFKNNPGQIWCPAASLGMDNEQILGELGYSPEQIKELYAKKVIANDPEAKMNFPLELDK